MVEFDVTMRGEDLYDYNLYHNYRHVEGILTVILGVVLLIVCAWAMKSHANLTYMIATGGLGVFFTLITPLRIWVKSYQQVKLTPSFQKSLHYRITSELLTLSQEDQTVEVPLEEIRSCVDTGKSIVLYVSKVRAYILPKREIGEQLDVLVNLLKDSPIAKNRL